MIPTFAEKRIGHSADEPVAGDRAAQIVEMPVRLKQRAKALVMQMP
jgi:hypothetical protein